MQSDYIIRTKNNELFCFFYTNENEIYVKAYNKGKWEKSELVISKIRQYYTITIAQNSEIYIFCQSFNGDMIMCKKNKKDWIKKIILESENISNVLFNSSIDDNDISIIYNIPITNKKGYNFLTYQTVNKKGHWSSPTQLDKISNFPESIFTTQTINNNHIIIAYQKKSPETQFGYREILNKKISNFNVVHTTGYQITDYSYIVTEDDMHFIYIVKGMFSSQIIYRMKNGNGFANPIIIADGQRLYNCIISIIKNDIYITWLNNGQLYFSISYDNGLSFSKPTKYQRKFCSKPKKAIYISENMMNKNSFVCHEIYVDNFDKTDIQILPELYEDFFIASIDTIKQSKSNIQQTNINNKVNRINHFQTTSQTDLDSLKQNIEILKNRYETLKLQLKEKENQVLQLTMLLKKRNDEIIQSENNWHIKYNELLNRLNHENTNIMQTSNNIDKQITGTWQNLNDNTNNQVKDTQQNLNDNTNNQVKDTQQNLNDNTDNQVKDIQQNSNTTNNQIINTLQDLGDINEN